MEVPLDDSEVSAGQFHRLVHAVMQGVLLVDGVIRHAMETGEVSFASVAQEESGMSPEIEPMDEKDVEDARDGSPPCP